MVGEKASERNEKGEITMYEFFTNQYKLIKTLRFGLIPQGKTLDNIEKSGILDEDMIRAEDAAKVKDLANQYHKNFINRTLKDFSLEGLEAYEAAFLAKDVQDNADKILDKEAKALRIQISKAFSKDNNTEFDAMFSGKMYSELLPNFFEGDQSALDLLEKFSGFTTYFTEFNRNRKLLYEASDEKGMPKHGSIACRLIDENLVEFIKNNRRLSKAMSTSDTILAAEKELEVLLNGESITEIFSLQSYNICLTQAGIDRYNQIIGGYSLEDGKKIKGLNEHINLYNQGAEKEDKLQYFKPLKKQILSERTTLSFIPEKFVSDEDVEDALVAYDETITDSVENLSEIIGKIREYDLDNIYIKAKSLSHISNKVFDSWHYISDLLSIRYDEQSGVSEKKMKTKTYAEKKRKALDKVTYYSIGELDAIPGIDGKIAGHLIGSAFLLKSSIEMERKNLLKRIETRRRRNNRSLKRDDYAKADIQAYLDACLNFKRFINDFDMAADDIDFDFYTEFEKHTSEIRATNKLYDKTRNYCSGKLYSNDQVKLNFKSSVFLDGWSENKEKSKLGTILLKDGRYFLGIIAKGQGDLFGKIPEAKTDNVYRKMVYNTIGGASKQFPRLFISSDTAKKTYSPNDNILRIYEEKTFQKENFNKRDFLEYVNYCKDCIKRSSYDQVYDFRFSDPETYTTINDFYNEADMFGYSLKFKDVDVDEIDRLVDEGRLYLFEIWHKDFSDKAYGKPDLSTIYFKALFEEENLSKGAPYHLNGGAEMFYRKASIKDVDIIKHKAGESLEAKTSSANHKNRTFSHDIVKDKRFTMDHFQLNVPITINANCPGCSSFNTEALFAIKRTKSQHVIGVSRGENSLIHITVIDSHGKIVETKSLNVIETGNGKKTDYAKLLSEREAERDSQRKKWETVEGIRQLKEGYLSQVIHIIVELMLKYDAIIAIEDLSMKFKQKRQKIEKAVYQQFEQRLISKLNFIVRKDASPNELGGVYNGYQLTAPFESFEKIGKQTGFIFYVSPWDTTAIDPETGFVNLFDTRYTNIKNAQKFWGAFDVIYYDEVNECYRFAFDYTNFATEKKLDMLKGTKTKWTVCTVGERIMSVKTDKGIQHKSISLTEEINKLFKEYDINIKDDLKAQLCADSDKRFHERLLNLFRHTVSLRNGNEVISPVETKPGFNFDGFVDENGSYNIARKGLMIVDRIKAATDEQLTSKKAKERISLTISANDWLKYVQGL